MNVELECVRAHRFLEEDFIEFVLSYSRLIQVIR